LSTVNVTGANLQITTTTSGNIGVVSAAYTVSFMATAGEALTAGDVLCVGTDGKMYKADSDAAGKQMVTGVAGANATQDNPVGVAAFSGVKAALNSNLAAATPGDVLYLTATAGTASTTAPTASGNQVWRVGYVQTAGAAGANVIIFQPQYISTIT
jgi:hypothetical protein